MRLPDRRSVWHALGSAVALLCLALPNADAGASARTTQQARPMESAMAFALPSMPMATDRMPCMRSCLAPAPSAQSLGAECPPADEPPWPFLASPVPDAAWRFDTGGWRARLPVRLAYCRWLN